MTFIRDHQGNFINIQKVAIAKPYGEKQYFLETAAGECLGAAREYSFEDAIIQLIPADGWEIVEKFDCDGVWYIHTIPIICFGLFATGEIKPITNTEADLVFYNKRYWRHKSSPKILNPFVIFENEAEFLKDGGGDE